MEEHKNEGVRLAAERLREEEEENQNDDGRKRARYENTDAIKKKHDGIGLDENSNKCELCGGGSDGNPPDGFGEEDGWLGCLVGPINHGNARAPKWVHYQCAVWCPEVFFGAPGRLKNLKAALTRGQSLKCTRCRRPGATLGCRIVKCPKTYHLACARAHGCTFDHQEFLMACPHHRRNFQPHRKKFGMRRRYYSQQKDVEDQNDADGDEDFEDRKRDEDLAKVAPTFIGGEEGEKSPLALVGGWESVAGLQHVIQCMKEVVVFPLLYPELFEGLGITPPRGVLLHGHPGTGKTHVVRALVASCARGPKRIAYFSRKGADCLGKYVGDSEKHLRLLFQAAEESQPSIIFFDEIDGLAPCRTRQQDQTYNSVVSTLLALLDGLKSRGSVVVIGATNRPEGVDPALRRPGRFDREVYFPLPSLDDRLAILSLYTRQWPKPLDSNAPLLQWVASKTAGFAGADLQAICTQTAIIALKRTFPLKQVLCAASPPTQLPAVVVEENDWLEALLRCPPPCSRREAAMATNDVVSSPLPSHLIHCLLRPLSTLVVSLYLDERVCLPDALSRAATAIESVMVSALIGKRMAHYKWWSHVDAFVQEDGIANQIERKFCGLNLIEDSNSFGNYSEKPKGASFELRDGRGYRIMIAGSARSGQRHLASCILNCFVDHIQIRRIDIATIFAGCSDLAQGIIHTLGNCLSREACLMFMPRVDLWAIDSHGDQTLECDSHSTDDQPKTASRAWTLFIDQVQSLSLSTPFIILVSTALSFFAFANYFIEKGTDNAIALIVQHKKATAEVPFMQLPDEMRQFFSNDLSNYCRKLGAVEHTVTRFSVQTDGIFDHDLVINRSATKISRNCVKLLVQFIHQTIHDITSASHKCQPCTTHRESKSEHFARPDGQNSTRGNSNLVSAISKLGHQILKNRQFSELCWETSKLKEGPCADISRSEWKAWEFSSCVVHPNLKREENYGTLKGVVAVGLLAMRGVYTSATAVCADVGDVLHQLLQTINAKVDAGRDRLRYTRILSQAASLEDHVNTWAYTLRSLEQDSPRLETSRHGASNGNRIHAKVYANKANTECLISCCSDCLSILHFVAKKILMHEFGLKGFDWSTDNVHDVVMAISLDLLTALRKSFVEGTNLFDEKLREDNDKLLESLDLATCHCKISRNLIVVPMECSWHSKRRTSSSESNAFPPTQSMLHWEFIFRNGILVDVDPKKDYSFHCNFQCLCLSSLIQLILMIKKPF